MMYKDFSDFNEGLAALRAAAFSVDDACHATNVGDDDNDEVVAASKLVVNPLYHRPTGNGHGWGGVRVEVTGEGLKYQTSGGLVWGWRVLPEYYPGTADRAREGIQYRFFVIHPSGEWRAGSSLYKALGGAGFELEMGAELLPDAYDEYDDDDDEYDAYDDDDENDDLPQQVSIAHVSVPVGFMTPSALEERFNVLRGTVNAAARRNPIQRWHVALDGRTRIVDVKHSLLTWGDDWCVHPGKMLAAHLDPPDGVWKLQCLDHASHTWKQNYASKEALLDAMAELAPLKEWSSRPDDIDEVLA